MDNLNKRLREAKDNDNDSIFIEDNGEGIEDYLKSENYDFKKGFLVNFGNSDNSLTKKVKTEEHEITKILDKIKHIQTEIHGLKYHTVAELERKKKHLISELHSKYNKDICHNCIKRGKIILTTWGVYCEDCNKGMRTGWEF